MRSVRVYFKKYDDMKFISHLDMNRFMIRVIRMSKIPVWYSEGFNPHPYITFALPLSLGFDSEYEIMDIRLDDDEYPNEQVSEKLKPLMPKGIEVFGCADPVMKAGDIAYADFRISLSDDLQASELEAFLSSDVIEAEKRTKKGGVKTINLKEYIKQYSFDGNNLVLTLAAGGSNNLNPKLIMDAFGKCSGKDLSYSVTRTMLYNEKMEVYK